MKEVLKKNDERMQRRIDHLVDEFKSIRAGRANAAVLDKVTVDYYGVPTPITQLAGVKVPEASLLIVEPWDKTSLRAIERAIMDSDLGITPSNDGISIRLPFPKPTEERRKLVKECNKDAEEGKIAVRNARRHANEKVERAEKDGEVTEDDVKREKKAIQKLTDDYTKRIDELLKAKSAEVMEI